jgi:hypothetical protein
VTRSSTPRVYPQGGLGNQLFALAAAYVIAGKTSSQVILDGSMTQFGSNLSREFELSNVQLLDSDSVVFENSIFSQTLRAREWVRRRLRLPIHPLEFPRIDYLCKNPKLSEFLLLVDQFSSFSGQFQDVGMVDAAVAFGFPTVIRPSIPSKNYNDFKSNLDFDFHAIHIRGGDYKKQRDTYPRIPLEYYTRAIEQSAGLPVVLFTDDLKFAKSEYPQIVSNAAKVIGSRESLSAIETMSLMSFGQIVTTANSTFSFWAGWFSTFHSSQVNTVVPYHLDDWVDTLPKDWYRFNLFSE